MADELQQKIEEINRQLSRIPFSVLPQSICETRREISLRHIIKRTSREGSAAES
jgi:hypothetical protein